MLADAKDSEAGKDRELEREYPDIETALERVRKHCGFSWSKPDTELAQVMRQAFLDQLEIGKPVWRTASQMISAWKLQREQGTKLRARYGPMKFFSEGHWIDPQGWHWNTELIEREAGARVGSV